MTGASTGIGKACALHLDGLGFRVFGSVRKQADADALSRESGGRIRPLLFDVTDPEAIAAGATAVADAVGDAGLFGLVNNAGIAVAGPVECVSIAELRKQFEVSVFGLAAVTQVFLPLIRKARGRIVNMGSLSGRLALPMVGPYAAAKHALEALTDALRLEVSQWGIHVALIEPGTVQTPIWDKSEESIEAFYQDTPEELQEHYASMVSAVSKYVRKTVKSAVPPEVIARTVAHALTARKPRTRYPVGKDAKLAIFAARFLPDRFRDNVISRQIGIKPRKP